MHPTFTSSSSDAPLVPYPETLAPAVAGAERVDYGGVRNVLTALTGGRYEWR
jgi:hypothetical protein